jgi:hypothetical protein
MHVTAPLARQAGQSKVIDRNAELSRLVPLWPAELADLSIAGRRRICALLGSSLRRERQRGIGGHWTYDVSRHAALARMLRSETACLRAIVPQAAKLAATASFAAASPAL